MDNKVTIEKIVGKIIRKDFHIIGEKTTICLLTLENGFEVHGFSACVDPANFDKALGEKYSYEDAVNKIWPLEAYLLQELLCQAG